MHKNELVSNHIIPSYMNYNEQDIPFEIVSIACTYVSIQIFIMLRMKV